MIGTSFFAYGYSSSNPVWTFSDDEANSPVPVASGEYYNGVEAGLFTSTASAAVPSGRTQGRAVESNKDALKFPITLEGVTVYIRAKQPSLSAASQFAVAYSTSSIGNSGWNYFTPTASWQTFSFTFSDPDHPYNPDYIGIWADTSGSGLGVVIDSIWVKAELKVEPNVTVKLTSWTGAEIATYRSNTETNSVTNVRVSESARHGIESFSFELSNDILDPLFTNMVCNIYVDGVWKSGGYTEVIPGIDSFQDKLTITGKGWAHKLKTVVINESYVDDSLDTIVKHVASTYLGADLGIIYNVANISVPVINNLYLDFNDKTLWDVFDTLIDIANFDYPNTNYRALPWFEAQEFYFDTPIAEPVAKWFEGYQYHNPKVETISNKLVNKVLTYRTTQADDKVTEYVATYSNAESIANYGEHAKKITASDYYVTNGLSKIADSIINRYKDPLTRVTIDNLDLDVVPLFHRVVKFANFRRTFFKTINQMESLTGWNVTNLLNTVASISTDQVYTNRTSMKLVSSVGSANDEMVYTLPEIIYSPTNFRIFAYKEELGSEYTVILTDSFANEVSVTIGGNNEPIDEWIEYKILINLEVGVETLAADENITTEDDLYVDKDGSTEDIIGIDYLIRDGILNIATVKIVVNSNIVATTYFDEMSVEASVPVEHTLWFEGAEYNYSASRTAKVTFGDTQDSLIDEVKKSVKHGNTAFDVYSKT